MGPPREHGGMACSTGITTRPPCQASMGPPREHGGMRLTV